MWQLPVALTGAFMVCMFLLACLCQLYRKRRKSQGEFVEIENLNGKQHKVIQSNSRCCSPINESPSIQEQHVDTTSSGPKEVLHNGGNNKQVYISVAESSDPVHDASHITENNKTASTYVELNVTNSDVTRANGHVTADKKKSDVTVSVTPEFPIATSTLRPVAKGNAVPRADMNEDHVNQGGMNLERRLLVQEMVREYEQNNRKNGREVEPNRVSISSQSETHGVLETDSYSDEHDDRKVKFCPTTEDIPDTDYERESSTPSETYYTRMIDESFNFEELTDSQSKKENRVETMDEQSSVLVNFTVSGQEVSASHAAENNTQDEMSYPKSNNDEVFTIETSVGNDDNDGPEIIRAHERSLSQVSFQLPDDYKDKPYSPMKKNRIWTSVTPEYSNSHYSVEFKGSKKAKLIFGQPSQSYGKLIIGQPMIPHSTAIVDVPKGSRKSKGPFNSSFTRIFKTRSKESLVSRDKYDSHGSRQGSVSVSLTGSKASKPNSVNGSLRSSQILNEKAGSYFSSVSLGGSSLNSLNEIVLY